MLTRRAALCGATCLLAVSAMPALAHDAPRVETEVTWSPDGTVDVEHVLQISMVQRLLHRGGIIDENDLTGLKARAQTALYAAERFDLMADGKPVELSILGAEVEGPHLYIYQTGQIGVLPSEWDARNAILRDLNPRFDNLLNLPTATGKKTLMFGGRDLDEVKSVAAK